jgi:hypothetical protein
MAARISRTSLATKKKKLMTCSGVPLKRLRSTGILGRDANRTGVEVALAHHDAAGCNQRRGREAELVGTEQSADDHVAAGLETAIDLQRDARTKAVEHQRLLGFGKTDFPWRAGMLERGQRDAPVPPS